MAASALRFGRLVQPVAVLADRGVAFAEFQCRASFGRAAARFRVEDPLLQASGRLLGGLGVYADAAGVFAFAVALVRDVGGVMVGEDRGAAVLGAAQRACTTSVW